MSCELNIRYRILITNRFFKKTSHAVLPVGLLLDPSKWELSDIEDIETLPTSDLLLDHLHSVRLVLASSFQEPLGPARVRFHKDCS